MKNLKRFYKKYRIWTFSVFLIFVLNFVLSKTYADDVNFVDLKSEALTEYFSPIEFVFGGNNFPGGFIWTPSLSNAMKIKDAVGNERNCRKQLAGFYYNAVRGNRLWPIDQQTLQMMRQDDPSYNDLQLEGGLFTSCDEDPYGRYGMIKYTYKGVVSYLIAGVKYDFNNFTYIPQLAYSFMNYENTTPIGYIYDTYGGIGFVGGSLPLFCHSYVINQVDNGKTLDEVIIRANDSKLVVKDNPTCQLDIQRTGTALDTMWSISVAGNASLSKALDKYDRRNIKGNLKDSSLVQVTNITIGKIVQKIRRVADQLCKGKQNQAGGPLNFDNTNVICALYDNYSDGNIVNIDLNTANYKGKTIIVRNANVVLHGSMPVDKYMDLFIDKGNLLLDNGNGTPTQKFDAKGYPDDNGQTAGILLQGNFIINGLILGYDGSNIVPYNHKLFLHGKITSLNTPTVPQKGRINQVSRIKASQNYTGYINLQNVFVWKCNPMTSKGTDGIDCGSEDGNNFMVPLYLIDHKYFSRLLR